MQLQARDMFPKVKKTYQFYHFNWNKTLYSELFNVCYLKSTYRDNKSASVFGTVLIYFRAGVSPGSHRGWIVGFDPGILSILTLLV